jgi:hypothetical protein
MIATGLAALKQYLQFIVHRTELNAIAGKHHRTPHDRSILLCYLRNRSWPLRECDKRERRKCRWYPSYLWHLPKLGKVVSVGQKGFELHFLCTWCREEFLAGEKGDCTIGFCSPQEPLMAVMPPVLAPSRS